MDNLDVAVRITRGVDDGKGPVELRRISICITKSGSHNTVVDVLIKDWIYRFGAQSTSSPVK